MTILQADSRQLEYFAASALTTQVLFSSNVYRAVSVPIERVTVLDDSSDY